MKQYEAMKHGTDEFPIGIHDTICETGFSLYPHIHREFEFLVMCEGSGTVYIENEKYFLEEGEGVFINSEELHIGIKTDSKKAVFFAIVFAPEAFGTFSTDAIVQKYVEPVIKNKIQPHKRLSKRVVEKLCLLHHATSKLKIKSLLFDIWDECISTAENKTDMSKIKSVEEVKKAMEYIRTNYSKDITLDNIADYVNMSKGYLCRLFKSVVHMTPFEYLIRVRTDEACEMLKNTNLSVGEIAGLCGFNSFSYFTKIFGQKTGCSPREYRYMTM